MHRAADIRRNETQRKGSDFGLIGASPRLNVPLCCTAWRRGASSLRILQRTHGGGAQGGSAARGAAAPGGSEPAAVNAVPPALRSRGGSAPPGPAPPAPRRDKG